jgi:hypothetical protein
MRSLLFGALFALAIYTVHVGTLGSWIIDDAGISYAYARSLAEGHGLVAQPGIEPVEGFTNLLWVLLLWLPLTLGGFDPVLTPKLLAGFFVLLSFLCLGHLLSASRWRPWWLVTGALTITAATSGFAIWTASGLENGLYVLTVSLLAWSCSPTVRSDHSRVQRALVTGLILFFVFCTRPDGALYFWIPAFLIGLENGAARWRRPLLAYVGAFVAPWLLLTLFRLLYFHDVMPNTFYAKQGEGAKIFAWLIRELPPAGTGLVVAVTGVVAIAAIALGCAGCGRWLRHRITLASAQRQLPALFLVTAIIIYHALRGDWMPEYRFATPAFLFGPAALLALAWDIVLAPVAGRGTGRRAVVAAATLVALGAVGYYSYHHTREFAKSPTIPFDTVCQLNQRMADVVAPLGPEVTLLTPDVGGALWVNRFRVVDLVGLIDRELARVVTRDRQTLQEQLLDQRRPDAVWLHSNWMRLTGFDVAPEFTARYAPVWETRTSPESPPTSGFYLRRDHAQVGVDGIATLNTKADQP